MRFISLLLTLTLLGGCTLGPDYVRPRGESPAAWRTSGQLSQINIGDTTLDSCWWEQLHDPVLNDLIDAAMRENTDLRLATARVEEYAARYGIARSDMSPQVGIGGQFGRQQTVSTFYQPEDSFSTTFSASWELDIWGRIRREGEAARAQLVATEEGRRAVILSLVSSVTGSYINLRNLDRKLEIGRQTAQSRRNTMDLFTKLYREETISDLELTQAKIQYEDAMASVAGFEKAITQQENALNVLLGRNPGPIPRGKTIEQLEPPQIPKGIPSTLLDRRPDIREAEQSLIYANAEIGVAKAAYFPAISLTGMLGSASNELSSLFTGPAGIWSYVAQSSAPIFTAGKISGGVKVSEAAREQALQSYRRTIQNAFREVEDSLIDQSKTLQQLEIREKQVHNLVHYLRLATMRYENGYSSYLEVLDAERNLFNGQLGEVQTRADLFLSIINLYKTMGGDWIEQAGALSAVKGPLAPQEKS